MADDIVFQPHLSFHEVHRESDPYKTFLKPRGRDVYIVERDRQLYLTTLPVAMIT